MHRLMRRNFIFVRMVTVILLHLMRARVILVHLMRLGKICVTCWERVILHHLMRARVILFHLMRARVIFSSPDEGREIFIAC